MHHDRSVARVISLLAGVAVLSAGAVAGVGSGRASGAEPEIVVRVNGASVTRAELQRMAADPGTRQQLQRELAARGPDSRELERVALRNLIVGRLLLEEAARRKLTVTEQELDGATTVLRHRFQGAAAFQDWLKGNGLDEKSLRETIRREMLTTRARTALVSDVRVTDQQVQEYYDRHKDDLKTAEEVRLRIIAADDKAAADKVVAALRNGGNLERLAQKQPARFRVVRDGDAGWVNSQSLSPALRGAVSALKAGEIGGPLDRDGELVIIRLEERRPARTKTLAEARREIERYLLTAKQQGALWAWLAEQEKEAKIEVVKHR